MHTIVRNSRINGTLLRFAPELSLVYGNNAKAACSSIKASLWTRLDAIRGVNEFRPGRVHALKHSPFVRDLCQRDSYDFAAFASATFFTNVRNPYTRALSAYLDKVGLDRWVWPPMCNRFGLRSEVGQDDLSFRDLLRLLRSEQPEAIDHHFVPQHLALVVDHVDWHFIGRLETPSEIEGFLGDRGIPMIREARHKTGAARRLEDYYGPEEIALVQEIYERDFALFGYSMDISQRAPIRPVQLAPSSGAVLDWLATGDMPGGILDPWETDFHAFTTSRDKAGKTEIAMRRGPRDPNWIRVRDYLHFLRKNASEAQAEPVALRLDVLRNRHRFIGLDPALFEVPRLPPLVLTRAMALAAVH